MALTVQAMVASLGIAAVGAGAAFAYARPGERYRPAPLAPRDAGLARLRLHRVEFAAFVLAACGVVSLIPEAMQAFAPELMGGRTLAGTAFEHLDYVAFVLVSLGFGLGVARRMLQIALEKASLAPCP